MAVTTSGETLFQNVVRKGGLGLVMLNADFTLSTTAITSALWLRNGNHGTNYWRNKRAIVYLPSNPTGEADYVRYAAALTASSGALAFDTALADGTLGSQNAYLLEQGVHPQWIIDAMNRALDIVYFENSEPLSLVQDAGSQATGTSADTESDADSGPATTHSKVTTASSDHVFTGIGASRVLNAAANGYIRQRFDVNPSQVVRAGAFCQADVGTGTLVFYDVTNGAEINAAGAPQHTGEQWAYLWREETMPAGCETLEVRWQGVGSTDDIYWCGRFLYRLDDRRIRLSTTWDTGFKVPALAYGRFGNSLAAGVQNAFSLDLVEIPQEAYSFQFERPGANPYAVQFHDTDVPAEWWFQYPIYIQGRRAHSDVDGPFALDLSGTTSADAGLFDAVARMQLFQDPQVQAKITDAAQRWSQADADFRDSARKFEQKGPARRREIATLRGLRN